MNSLAPLRLETAPFLVPRENHETSHIRGRPVANRIESTWHPATKQDRGNFNRRRKGDDLGVELDVRNQVKLISSVGPRVPSFMRWNSSATTQHTSATSSER